MNDTQGGRLTIARLVLLGAFTLGLATLTAHADVAAERNVPPNPSIPESPSRADVMRAMGNRAAAIRHCAPRDQTGTLTITVEFEPAGTVTLVEVTSTLPDSVEACVAAAVRSARVPPFRLPTFRVVFPFRY